ncbi:DUF6153 family protein [Frankia sp. AgKG'84/4]|uniref:DUF6153 family protein n=1 Tax=Frankia sp. AgKG'84/4 TaxID=573490 RepID=UPI00200F6136|nr:DUF6153 family protein [Frankia sp. AgKG'84/4]MCL9794152.1 DUF6153 family protein [Frankia sp. AgKG'84/4]
MLDDSAADRVAEHHATVPALIRAKLGGGRYSLLIVVVPLLFGVLVMHGGLSIHPGRTGPAGHHLAVGHAASSPIVGANATMTHPGPGRNATLGPPFSGGPQHGAHSGPLCMAVLRLSGLFLLIVLLASAARSARGLPNRFRRPPRPDRLPPGDWPHSPAPALSQLCVLRR